MNNNEFEQEVNTLKDYEVRDIVVNFHMHRGALVEAAKKELEKRNIELTEEEKDQIAKKHGKHEKRKVRITLNRQVAACFLPIGKRTSLMMKILLSYTPNK